MPVSAIILYCKIDLIYTEGPLKPSITVELAPRVKNLSPDLFATIDMMKQEARANGVDLIDISSGGGPKVVLPRRDDEKNADFFASYRGVPDKDVRHVVWVLDMMNTPAKSSVSIGTGSPLKAFLICHAVALLGVIMVLVPFLFEGVEKAIGDVAFAMVLVGGFFALTAFFSSFVFLHRLRVYRELFQEDRLLAHWQYSESEWRAFAGAELAAEKSVKRLLVLITAGFALLYCGLMAVLHPELVA